MNNIKLGKLKTLYYFVISFLIIYISSFFILFIIERQIRIYNFKELMKNEQRVVNMQINYTGKELNNILSDLYYLHHNFKKDLLNENLNSVSESWAIFSTQKKYYDQIRYIDENGMEKIRVNASKNGSYIVSEDKLQNKSSRYYFKETSNLSSEFVYISKIDLNKENNEIEIPFKPVIRLATPLYDVNNNFKGIIILNYLAKNSLETFKDLAKNSSGSLSLLNSDGYFISNEDKTLEWGFMFKDKKQNSFESMYNKEWNDIKNSNTYTQFVSNHGLFTAQKISLDDKVISNNVNHIHKIIFDDKNWYIISLIQRNNKNKSLFIDDFHSLFFDVVKKNSLYFIFLFFISSIIGVLIYINRRTYKRIKYYSEYDVLTKSYNRRAGLIKLNSLFPSDERRTFLVSLCFIDINGLKDVNDNLGHKMGDELIITVIDTIKSTIRNKDFVIRLGGDEFLIVFDGINVEDTEKIWNRILDKYENINKNENRPYFVSVSHGIVDYDNKQKSQVDDLIKKADQKMYEEKRKIKKDLDVIK
ncbi:diguanylate cyclase [Peptostreptococcaceae bacterium AGR-M142]